MNAITLKYLTTEQSLADWGFSDPHLTYRSLAAGTFTVRLPGGDPAGADAIPYGGVVTVKVDGTIRFVGKRTDRNGLANPKGRSVTMVFSDAWWDLEHGTYLTQWNNTTDGVTSSKFYSPRVWLFMNIGAFGGAYTQWTAAQQITDIINFANSFYGADIQAGTIDPLIIMPVIPVMCQTMGECIKIMLRTVPDAMSYFNYTTTPPTLHIRQRQNLTPVTLPYANGNPPPSGTQIHKSSEIKSRDDLAVPELVITYQTTDPVTGYVSISGDAYPPGSIGDVAQSLHLQFNLTGPQRTYVQGQVTATAFDPTTTTFWKTLAKQDFADADISTLAIMDATINASSGHPFGITIKDKTGAFVAISGSGSLPNILSPNSSVAPWMKSGSTQIVSKEVVITAYFTYLTMTDDGFNVKSVTGKHRVDYRCKLTNSSASGTQPKLYYQLQSAVAGETPPAFFAYQLWCSLNNVAVNAPGGIVALPGSVPSITAPENLQWDGWHEILEQTGISTFYDCHNTLNLDDTFGGNASWAEMNAAIYSVEFDFFRKATRINFGPPKHVSPSEFWELHMMARIRLAWDNPNVPTTGLDPAGAGVQTPSDTQLSNTSEHSAPSFVTHGATGPTRLSGDFTGQYWLHQIDAGSVLGAFSGGNGYPGRVAQLHNASDGSVDTSADSIAEFMNEITGESDPVVIRYRCIAYCKQVEGVETQFHRWMACSQEIAGSPPSGAQT